MYNDPLQSLLPPTHQSFLSSPSVPACSFWRAFFDWNDMYSMPALAGSIALLGGLLIWVTSLEWVRRNYFKVRS